jgi:DNA repair protein RadC
MLAIGRPRERIMLHGRAALSDMELIALVLGGGNSLQRAALLLQHFGGLRELDAASPHELAEVAGMGVASAAAVAAAFELGRRVALTDLPYTAPLRTPDDVAAYARARIGGMDREEFLLLGLDARQRVRLVHSVAVGSLSQVDVHPREVFRPLVRAGMHSVILVHNHPSGDAHPSGADVELTNRLCEVGRLVGIPVIDHLVVTRTDSVSFSGMGLLAAV